MSLTTSVIICAYTQNRWSQLLSAAESVRKQTTPVAEVLVVIDHNDELRNRAEKAMPWARVVASGGPAGLSGARNTGIAASTGEIVLFLDDDAVAEPDWSGHLIAAYDDPGVLGVGGAAHPVWEQSAPRWWPAEFGWVVGCSYRGQPVSTAPVRNLMGCNMSLRRTVLQAVGGFDDGLGRGSDDALGCEETELCIRARQLIPDGEFIFEPRAVVHHWVPRSRSSWSYFRARCRAEGISKARVAALVGRSAALSAEKAYAGRVLPTAIVRNVRDGVTGDLAALARGGAIATGVSLAALGFLSAKIRHRHRVRSDNGSSTGSGHINVVAPASPVLPLIVNLNEPLPAIEAWRMRDGMRYGATHCLVILDGEPIGRVRLDLASGSLTPQQVADQLWERLGGQIIGHRQSTSRPVPQSLLTHGLVSSGRSVVSSASPAPRADVVVATKDRPAMLRECLESILRGSVKPERVIVVDNASASSETAELVRQLAKQEPSVLYVREDEPGLARAHNAALPYVNSPVVAFTDDDVVVDEQWLKRIVQVFADDESVACVTGIIAPRELDTLPQQWVEGNVIYDKGLQRRTFDSSQPSSDPLFPYTAGAFGSGANMAFRASFLRKHGGFDEALGAGTIAMGGDDLAAFYDVISSGNRLVYEPAAIALHQHPRQYAALKRQSYGYGVGLGAHLTRCLLKSPGMALVFLRHAPAVIRRGTDVIRPATVGELPPYPRELSRVLWKGLASGPGRFLLSRRHSRRMGRTT
jgi:GT2 family glycosyltransferase